MTCSYIEGNVPKLIVRDIFRNIPRFNCNEKKLHIIHGESIHCHTAPDATTLTNRLPMLKKGASVNQQTIFEMNLGIFHDISRNVEVRKNPKKFWKDIYT